MRASAAVALGLFFLYAVWAAALQGLLAAPRQLGAWTPDLGLLLLACGLRRSRIPAVPPVLLVRMYSCPALTPAHFVSTVGCLGRLGMNFVFCWLYDVHPSRWFSPPRVCSAKSVCSVGAPQLPCLTQGSSIACAIAFSFLCSVLCVAPGFPRLFCVGAPTVVVRSCALRACPARMVGGSYSVLA